uniref:Uncharacterized protein n=1 Tax=Triticum urartu TaxID=4572 RepID=A0A8R7PG04_TRIUA
MPPPPPTLRGCRPPSATLQCQLPPRPRADHRPPHLVPLLPDHAAEHPPPPRPPFAGPPATPKQPNLLHASSARLL